MKVLLISANRLRGPYPVYPIGLDYVAGAIAPPHEVRIVDMNRVAQMDDLQAQIKAFAPQVVGISLRNIDNVDILQHRGFMGQYVELMQVVRTSTTAPIVLGGSGFTLFPEQIMRMLDADFGIVGEGERLRGLLQALECGESPEGMQGVSVRGQAVQPPPPWQHAVIRRFRPDADQLAFYLRQGGMLNLQTQRGCPFRCIYCTYPNIEGRRARRIDPAQVVGTALSLQKAGAKYLFITDSVFNADLEHSLAVARAMRNAGLGLPWGAFFSPGRFPADYFQVLARCGLRHVEFGTESLSDPVLAAYGKSFNKAEALAAHKAAREADLDVAHYFIFGGPGENSATLEESLVAMENLEHTVLFLFCGMRIYPGTPLSALALAEGYLADGQDLTEPVYYQSPAIDGAAMVQTIRARAQAHSNWVLGAGGDEMTAVVTRMYAKGYVGPLWEYLCR